MRDERKTREQLIAEVRELRGRLGSSELYLDTVLSNLPVGVAILEGSEFRYFRINKNLAELNGLPVEAHLGRPLAEVLPHAEESLIPTLLGVRTTGIPVLHRELSIKLPKDPERSVHLIHWMVSVNATNRASAVVVVVLDVTELKETQKQLAQSQKMEALGTLARGIAHDFNNILAAIQGNVEMVIATLPEDSDKSENLEVVVESTERAASLVQQILTFGRMKAPSLIPLELGDVIREALRMMEATLPENIEVHQVIQADCAHVMADATQMHEVMVNLCTNAWHAMEPAGGVLEVTLQESDQHPSLPGGAGRRCLKLMVKDTGSGIDPKDQERIFDPFFSTMEVGRGSGLGLSVVHGIVETHQGAITVESELGKGSTFSIFLPTAGEATVREVSGESSAAGGAGHILLVDDDDALRRTFQNILTNCGYEVTVASNGLNALAIFQEHPDRFDLVLSDQVMPHMTGTQLSRRVSDLRPDIPFIVLSGYADVISEENVQEFGVRKFLKKPVSLAVLKEVVEECLQ